MCELIFGVCAFKSVITFIINERVILPLNFHKKHVKKYRKTACKISWRHCNVRFVYDGRGRNSHRSVLFCALSSYTYTLYKRISASMVRNARSLKMTKTNSNLFYAHLKDRARWFICGHNTHVAPLYIWCAKRRTSVAASVLSCL